MPKLTLFIFCLISFSVQAEDNYLIKYLKDPGVVQVEACFDGKAPRFLVRHQQAGRYTDWIQHPTEGRKKPTQSSRLSLAGLPPDSCIRWQVNLAAAVSSNDYRIALKSGESIISDGDLWFWRDDERREIRAQVELPAGYSISTPWKEDPTHQEQNFTVERTPASWTSRIAIGNFQIQRIRIGDRELRLANIGNISPSQNDKFAQWMRQTALSVESVYGRFPVDQPQILVVAIGRQNEAVPWAHVTRGGGVAAEFFVDEYRSAREFRADWTAPHELSHMFLPMVSSRDRWLSEGLASYYQNVLRARDGRIDETTAWRKLHAGFERGEKATRGGTLASATRSGRGATMRVYWSGAAIFMKADVRLRELSNGSQSLDSALALLHGCCFDTGKSWRARTLLYQLDELTGFSVFSDLYNEHVMDEDFPDMSGTYHQLGLVDRSGSIELKSQAPLKQIRADIMQGAY